MKKQPLQIVATGLSIADAAKRYPMTRDMSEGTPTRCLSFFCLFGDYLNPEGCTSRIGRSPTYSYAKGERRKPNGRLVLTGEWSVKREWHPCMDLNTEVNAFLQDLLPRKDAVARCISEQWLSVSICSVFEVFNKKYPKLTLSLSTIEFLIEMSSEFSIDWYDFSEYDIASDDGETSIHATGVCLTTKSNTPCSCEISSFVDTSLETIVQAVIAELSKLNTNARVILRTDITVNIEVHNEDVPLLVLPLSLLKTLKEYKASLEIRWSRLS